MKAVALVYHFPLDLANDYLLYANRFVKSYKQFDAGAKHEVFLATSNPTFNLNDKLVLGDLPWSMADTYTGGGCDIGSYLSIAKVLQHDFVVFAGARVHFSKAGWLKRLLDAREQHGEWIYGASGSMEAAQAGTNPAPNPHLRTSFFACNPNILKEYKHEIKSREDCYRFENGELRFTRNQKAYVVSWDNCVPLKECRRIPNTFRRGNQTNMLAWDGHTDAYAAAPPEEKARLEELADGGMKW